MDAIAADDSPKRCTNCGAEVVDVYCARCGERQPDHHDYAVSHFAHHAFHELVHLDSKLFTTLKLLLAKPGFLTAEYFAGRKTRYIAPLRLFLTLFAIHLIAYTVYKPVAIYSMEGMSQAGGDPKPVEFLVDKVAKKKQIPFEVARERINEKMAKSMSLLQLFNILLFALALKLLYWRRYYVEHLVFAAHYLCFAYLFALAWWPFYLAFGMRNVQKPGVPITIVLMLAYLFFAIRRYYGGAKKNVIFKSIGAWIGVYVVQFLMMLVTLLAAVLVVVKS